MAENLRFAIALGDVPEYVVRLIGKVISVSLKTVEIVAGLPELGVDLEGEGGA